MNLVVHIGSHKTGSTSIQDYCYENSEKLEANNIYYPKNLFDIYPRQHSAFTKIIADRFIPELERKIEIIVNDATDVGCDTVFISGEDFCTISSHAVKMLAKITNKYFQEKTTILILRNKKDYFYSTYKHYLRYGKQITESDFKNAIKFSPSQCINAWKNNFEKNLLILNYDDIKDDLLRKFFHNAFNMSVEDNIRKNRSLDYLTLIIYNAFLKQYKSKDIDQIIWDINVKHPSNDSFDIESKIASFINSQFSSDDWASEQLSKMQCSLLEDKKRSYKHDPIVVCDRLKELFSSLGEHFRALNGNLTQD